MPTPRGGAFLCVVFLAQALALAWMCVPPRRGVHVAIMTVHRDAAPPYLCNTLRSVFEAARPRSVTVFHLAIGAEERHAWVPDGVETCMRVASRAHHVRLVQRGVNGAIDAYDLVIEHMLRRVDGLASVLVLEDDVVLESRFEASLASVLGAAEERVGREFVLSLYHGKCCGTVAEIDALISSNMARELPALELRLDWQGWGTQAMLFSGRALLLDLHRHFVAQRGVAFMGLQDIFLDKFARGRGYPICGVSRSLVQHVGAHSAIFGNNSDRFHASLSFVS